MPELRASCTDIDYGLVSKYLEIAAEMSSRFGINGDNAILVGSPTYHHDMPVDFKNLFEEAAVQGISLNGKIGAAFGSYGWSGEAPKLILEIMKYKFEMKVVEPPLLAKYVPDQSMLNACKDLGKQVSESLMNRA